MRLQLTKRTDYAIRACLYLASNQSERPASSALIAGQMEIPERFLPRVLGDLNKAGIVEAQIGRSGGYRLLRVDVLATVDLADIVVADRSGRVALSANPTR